MKMSERKLSVSRIPYGVTNCIQDICNASELAPGPRGAAITAAKKRLKAEIATKWVMQVAQRLDLDMTPTFAVKLIKGWLSRCVSRQVLLKEFGIPGRASSNKSSDIDLADGLIETYKNQVNKEIDEALTKVTVALKST